MTDNITSTLQNMSVTTTTTHECINSPLTPYRCNTCKQIKNAEYARSERGFLIKQHSAVRTRFARRADRIKEFAELMLIDMDILKVMPEEHREDIIKIITSAKRLCSLDMKKFKHPY